MEARAIEEIVARLESGGVVPYLGPGVLALAGQNCPLPLRRKSWWGD